MLLSLPKSIITLVLHERNKKKMYKASIVNKIKTVIKMESFLFQVFDGFIGKSKTCMIRKCRINIIKLHYVTVYTLNLNFVRLRIYFREQ